MRKLFLNILGSNPYLFIIGKTASPIAVFPFMRMVLTNLEYAHWMLKCSPSMVMFLEFSKGRYPLVLSIVNLECLFFGLEQAVRLRTNVTSSSFLKGFFDPSQQLSSKYLKS